MLFNRRILATVTLAVLVGTSAAPSLGQSRIAPASDAVYAKLAKAYFDESFRANPVNATATGSHTYDTELGSYEEGDYALQIARDHRYLDS